MIVIGDQLLLLRSHAEAAKFAGEEIRVGVCGLGRQGQLLLKTFLKVPGVEIASLCDVNSHALRKASLLIPSKRGKRGPSLATDFRRMLDDRSLDAVVIATPDNWHAQMGIWACDAGKDCYIESPCSQTFESGRLLVTTAQKYQRVVQYGSLGQLTDVSGVDPIALACLGKIQSARTIVYIGESQANAVHDDLHRNLHMLGSTFPSRVSTLTAGRAGTNRTAVQMEFANDKTQRSRRLDLEVIPMSALPPHLARVIGKSIAGSNEHGIVSETTITGSNGTLTTTTPRNPVLETEYLVQNFVMAVRERNKQLLAAPINEAHVTCGSSQLANISMLLKRPINFDPASQSAPDDAEVQQLLLGKTEN
jgi:hypothetical protein